jgi:hypothetical protein
MKVIGKIIREMEREPCIGFLAMKNTLVIGKITIRVDSVLISGLKEVEIISSLEIDMLGIGN